MAIYTDKGVVSAKLVVPAEGIEPPTFSLQNCCSTAELSRRHGNDLRARIADLVRRGQNLKTRTRRPRTREIRIDRFASTGSAAKGGPKAAFCTSVFSLSY